ncbi:MAG: GH3 auxin-responsive promoter family protein [Gammaproteobacteria bacterium]|nr:GH3 auxin-responsive promoter family protein [Gammaproteobacteria bacterium]
MQADTAAGRVLPWVIYPLVVSASIFLYQILDKTGLSFAFRSYIAAGVGAILVTAFELALPHRGVWKGAREDVRGDALYMVLVQMMLPVALALTLSVFLLHRLQAAGVDPARFWPHAWPVPFQVVLMLLGADFLRYWLHRACHHWEPLWRLHAVHHSPLKLYWLNVGRFHPLEKTLQYLLDALPFVLMGVGEPVLGLYFVFYAVNGFFQHSNVELRFGWLNWIISSAELHRWHHSRIKDESNTNYGNNLIVWDVLFRTRFLPEDREITDIGLPNRRYPRTFLEQMKTPFVKGIETADSDMVSWVEIAANGLIRLQMMWIKYTAWRRLVAAARHPRRTQLRLLRKILKANRNTAFGRQHGFQNIRTFEDYRKHVAVQSYESLRLLIEEQDRSGSAALTAEQPAMYAQTSGTTGAPKYIPVLASSLKQHRECQNLFSYVQFRAGHGAYDGRLLAIVSPAVEGHLETGTPYGSTSGHLYRNMPAIMRAKYVLPWQVFTIEDYDLKYLLILRLAIVQRNITYMSTANPSTLLRLITLLDQHRLELLHDVQTGTFSRASELPPDIVHAIRDRLSCSTARRDELTEILQRENPAIRDLWPYLKLLATWTSGSCGIALKPVRASLPKGTRVAELGYLSSEFFGTITVEPASRGLPTHLHNFFEFVAKQSWETGDPEFLTLDQLELGGEYYVLVTTQSGLYRYFMNDIVRVTGRFQRTPTIEFVQKGKGVTSITGEKLYESQVIQAVKAAEAEVGASTSFFILVADPEAAVYRLLIEPAGSLDASHFSMHLDRHLCGINLEYAHKRSSGRLAAVVVSVLRPGAAEAYKMECLARGQREGQFKVQVLQWAKDLNFPFVDYAL